MKPMKQFLVVMLLFLVVPFRTVHSQQAETALREVFQDAEFFLADEAYIDALQEYNKLYKRGYDKNPNINYRIGICYLNIPGQKQKSVPYLEEAVKTVSSKYKEGNLSEKSAPIDAWLYLGNSYRINYQLDKAIAAYNKYKELLGKGNAEGMKYTDQQIAACMNAQEYMKLPVEVKEENLGSVINTSSANIKPVVSGDENTLAYVTRLKLYDAVFLSRKVSGVWTEPENLTPQIVSDGDQYTSCLSFDGNTLFLTKEDLFNSDILVSNFAEGSWKPSVPLDKNINTKYWESHASISSDGNTLYFASNRNDGLGETDIWYAAKDAAGKWGPARNIGKVINTELNEDCPFITSDGNRLYFSSQGHKTMGGYDIFYSTKTGDNAWSEPVNLGYPANSTDDDIFFEPVQNGKYAYISKFQQGGFGDDDIYRIEILPPALAVLKPEPVTETIPVPPVETAPDTIKSIVTELVKEPVKEEPVQEVVKEPINEPVKEPQKEIVQERFLINGILFGFDKSDLTPDALKQLDILAQAMKASGSVIVEVTGYADSKGSDTYNLNLSKKRAIAVVNYLKSKGVATDRLQAAGKGEKENIAINSNPDGTDSPAGRKYNRRVEFTVLQGGTEFIVIETVKVPVELQAR
jgi:outer membrane protein OmpA-like peptidoglycan-associated protein